MDQLFRRLPLPVKLLLIGLVPLVFLIYLATKLYHEKSDNLRQLERYMYRIYTAADLSHLNDALQNERKISFDLSMNKSKPADILRPRRITDSILKKLDKSDDPALYRFMDYTSLSRLNEVRLNVDSGKVDPNNVMHFYSNSIFRLNTLNVFSLTNNQQLQSINRDLTGQKLISEMATYLGIIRSNIYNVLHTRKYMVETLFGLSGTFDVYKSYEREFQLKASPSSYEEFQRIRYQTDFKPMRRYLDSVFTRFSFDNSLTADEWWKISDNGINELSRLQQTLWSRVELRLKKIYADEKSERTRTFILLFISIVLTALLISYIMYILSRMLLELKLAATKIAKGDTDILVKVESRDALGDLSSCIAEIAENNRQLAEAANSIGKGQFDVYIEPRSERDVLGNSIIRMKESLQKYSEKMEALVKQRTEELEKSNEDLMQFAHVTSHDLKEPLRKMRTYISLLMNDLSDRLTEKDRNYLQRIDQSASRMTNMIEGILNYSSLNAANERFEQVDLNAIVSNISIDLELLIQQKKARIEYHELPKVEGAPVLLNQLFYNLMNNALKFSRPGIPPVVRISHRQLPEEECSFTGDENCYEITIEDNGIGFDPEFSEKIFNTFSRLHSKNDFEGTGLGLALCRRIVRYHKGKIWAESIKDGAIFRMVLPQKQRSESLVPH